MTSEGVAMNVSVQEESMDVDQPGLKSTYENSQDVQGSYDDGGSEDGLASSTASMVTAKSNVDNMAVSADHAWNAVPSRNDFECFHHSDQQPQEMGSTVHSHAPYETAGKANTASNINLNVETKSAPLDLLQEPGMNIQPPLEHQSAEEQASPHADYDLVNQIPAMYRLLDLLLEQGSGGLVDKIVIAQESLGRLINDLRPGAYTSMTKVDFKALDEVSIKPVGVYGSKGELVHFLDSLGVLNTHTTELLLRPYDDRADLSSPYLRPGLYFVRSEMGNSDSFILFWPEESTWDDDAISSVQKNRVTFMRYLSKLVDQTFALLSPEHSSSIKWKHLDDGGLGWESGASNDFGRMFTFEVAKTKEEDENVTVSNGFELTHPDIRLVQNDLNGDYSLPSPTLVAGTMHCAFVTAEYQRKKLHQNRHTRVLNQKQIELLFRDGYPLVIFPLSLHPQVADSLVQNDGMRKKYPNQCAKYIREKEDYKKLEAVQRISESQEQQRRAVELRDETIRMAETLVRRGLVNAYPAILVFDASEDEHKENHPARGGTKFNNEVMNVIQQSLQTSILPSAFVHVDLPEYQALKQRILSAVDVLDGTDDFDEATRLNIAQGVLEGASSTGPSMSTSKAEQASRSAFWIPSMLRNASNLLLGGGKDTRRRNGHSSSSSGSRSTYMSDPVFVETLAELQEHYPVLNGLAEELRHILHSWMTAAIGVQARSLTDKVLRTIEDNDRANRVSLSKARQVDEAKLRSRRLVESINEAQSKIHRTHELRLVTVVFDDEKHRTKGDHLHVEGAITYYSPACITIHIHPIELTQGDKHGLREDPTHIPRPRAHHKLTCRLALQQRLRLVQRVDADRYLMVIDNEKEQHCEIFLEQAASLSQAIANGSCKKRILFSKFSKDFKLAFDGATRLLAVCGQTTNVRNDLQLQVWLFDEHFSATTSRGTPIKLETWYESVPVLTALFFVAGTEELCLVENTGRTRIFSLVTEQFRPAVVHLNKSASLVASTPDGSCLVAVTPAPNGHELTAHHFSTFGSNPNGIRIPFQSPSNSSFAMTTLESSSVHLLVLSPSSQHLKSFRLQIQKKSKEFLFKQHGCSSRSKETTTTLHNSLLDCHADVWTRFPVQAAIQRETINPNSRRPIRLAFISSDPCDLYEAYMHFLAQDFQRRTQKPTGFCLDRWLIQSLPHVDQFLCNNISNYAAGEWVVELLCLIPLHIAVTHQNRFIPLKDGVLNPDYERKLLGADVEDIVDALSMGWYESLFRSYMVTKPVRVVSSMGEQSVGKSYCLNHFADTSFAGSAMRTTEGVWMSVTPTQNSLVVALDFEGVHSIERSPQEDALLVLFNTAISNLVLFRNNFALSRDIAGLFTSFQSSSSILDPDANPSLFNGVLAIIIRDVVDSDKDEIVKEFYLKFQKIVQDEQEGNFISRLHRGRLNIVPWPVINSPSFYTLFGRLKIEFERQDATHPSAGVFLHTLKTLMAKLKANDWGALDQNLSAHRAHLLELSLSTALASGLSETEPDQEPLRNLDTNSPISLEVQDSDCVLYVQDPSSDSDSNDARRRILTHDIRKTCEGMLPPRFSVDDAQWATSLQDLLDRVVDARISHVTAWLDSNTARFGEHEALRRLRREAEHAFLDLRNNMQLCTSECSSCGLRCIELKHHVSIHSCQTSHTCWETCDVADEHTEDVSCGLPAGHTGRHMCDVGAHSCGAACSLQGKKGCLGACNLPMDHEQDLHMCAARLHSCGEPCALQRSDTGRGDYYSCSAHCVLPWNEPHKQHACENSQFCPLECQLCPRLCGVADHFHGLAPGAIHLCGQEHDCLQSCELPGICHIDTQASEILEQFSGKHEVFQYTKYTQVARRLTCVRRIPANALYHAGQHQHSMEEKLFHFCETRCKQCQYFCTLPLGHTQTVHETRHGSMSGTRWLVDSPDDTVELNGHKFGSDDDGAPMLCSLVCADQGRHVHVDFCRAAGTVWPCDDAEVQHIQGLRMLPSPERPKDWLSHRLFWARLGFKDPYSREEQVDFAKCDSMCGGSEHQPTQTAPAQPSFCSLDIFHPARPVDDAPADGQGYVSPDGHLFACPNPALLHQAFHVIFVVDGSSSMTYRDRVPLPDMPSSGLIRRHANNRYGAVLSALHSFWMSRDATLRGGVTGIRRDAYSVITFSNTARTRIANDFTSTPNELLNHVLVRDLGRGTNFTAALQATQQVMENNWHTERSPVVIFLSDGECRVGDEYVYDLCRRAVVLGKALSMHTVSFGRDAYSHSLRRMVHIAGEVYASAPRGPLDLDVVLDEPCRYTDALNEVQLAETFLEIANSLRKTRAALLRPS